MSPTKQGVFLTRACWHCPFQGWWDDYRQVHEKRLWFSLVHTPLVSQDWVGTPHLKVARPAEKAVCVDVLKRVFFSLHQAQSVFISCVPVFLLERGRPASTDFTYSFVADCSSVCLEMESPWCDLRGWLGVKQQLSIYLEMEKVFFPLSHQTSLNYLCGWWCMPVSSVEHVRLQFDVMCLWCLKMQIVSKRCVFNVTTLRQHEFTSYAFYSTSSHWPQRFKKYKHGAWQLWWNICAGHWILLFVQKITYLPCVKIHILPSF